jgi:Cu(I)/Ag(I) efflux system membrane protein CusA/SilA
MAAAALLSITLGAGADGLADPGEDSQPKTANPINRWLTRAYRPALDWVLDRPNRNRLCSSRASIFAIEPVADQPGLAASSCRR